MSKKFTLTFVQLDGTSKSVTTLDIPDYVNINTTTLDIFINDYILYLSNRVSLEVPNPTINDALNSMAMVSAFENFIKKYKTDNGTITI